jgi:Fe-S-cluster containining protein
LSTRTTREIDAGDFGEWKRQMTAMLRGTGGIAVPCGDCRGCCSAYWPVALRSSDAAAAVLIPSEWLMTPANAPPGVSYMSFRPDGTCPMLTAGNCQIYSHRPQTCRDFDCRIFAATGIQSAGDGRQQIDDRIGAWRFRFTSPADEATRAAMQAAASFIQEAHRTHPSLPLPASPIAIAGLAFKAHQIFLTPEPASLSIRELVDRVLAAGLEFDRWQQSNA